MRLLIATTNPNKVREIRQLLDGVSVDLVTLAEWPQVTAPEETGLTFEENARAKALYYAAATGELTVAEDSGLAIDALDGAPGVESARYGGVATSYPEKFALIYDALRARNDVTRVCVQLGANQTIINLPATAQGLEAEINSHPVAGLTLQLGVSALSSNVKDIVLPDTVTHVEHDMPQSPNFSANALARYEFAVGSGSLSLQADAQYSGDFCFTVLCAPVEKESSYTVLNARIGYAGGDGRWDVAAFVDNLSEEQYRVYAFDSSLFAGVVAAVYGKPRTWGVSASYRFGAVQH